MFGGVTFCWPAIKGDVVWKLFPLRSIWHVSTDGDDQRFARNYFRIFFEMVNESVQGWYAVCLQIDHQRKLARCVLVDTSGVLFYFLVNGVEV